MQPVHEESTDTKDLADTKTKPVHEESIESDRKDLADTRAKPVYEEIIQMTDRKQLVKIEELPDQGILKKTYFKKMHAHKKIVNIKPINRTEVRPMVNKPLNTTEVRPMEDRPMEVSPIEIRTGVRTGVRTRD
jgi:hypothetical protein